MTGEENASGESYEDRIKRMRMLEEELAREKAKLEELERQRSEDMELELKPQGGSPVSFSPPPSDTSPKIDPSQIPDLSPPVGSVIPQDDLEDIHGSQGGYSENLMLPDEDLSPEPSSKAYSPLSSMTQEISLDTAPDNSLSADPIPVDPVNDPARQLSGEELEVSEYRREIDEFRDRGYNVNRMYSIFSQDIDTIRSSVIQIMGEVNKLKDIERQLNELDVTGFESDVESLRALLMNPDMVENANTFFVGLRSRIDSKESRERENRLFEVEDLFEETIKEFSGVTTSFVDQIQDIKVAIIDMEEAPIEEYRNVKKMIFDLKDAMIQEKLAKEKVDERRSLHEDLKEWNRKGFIVSEIETVIERDLKKGIELYEEFLVKANRLLELETELNTVDVSGFEKEIREIRDIIKDTEKIILVENKIKSLKRRIRLSGIQTKMDRLRAPDPAKRTGPTEMTCPKCNGVVPIQSDERPLKVNCSSCRTEFHLKRIPSRPPQGEVQTIAPSTGPGDEDQGITVAPIVDEPSASVVVAPLPPAQPVQPLPPMAPPQPFPPSQSAPAPPQPKCPGCGADLLPDSVFCGLCGHRME